MASAVAITIAGLAAFLRTTYAPFYYAKIGVVKSFWMALLPIRIPFWLMIGTISAAFAFDSPSSYLITALLIGTISGIGIFGVMTGFSVMVERLTSTDGSHVTSFDFDDDLSPPPASDSDHIPRKKPFDKSSRRTIRPSIR